jgi:hypothetical protein
MKRPLYGFWQRFLELDRKTPRGPWHFCVYPSRRSARIMHASAEHYSLVGPIFKTSANIPKRQ